MMLVWNTGQYKFWYDINQNNSCFSDFVFKIRLIRLDFSFKKLKSPVLYFKSQPTDSPSGVITITPKSQLWERGTEKLSVTFCHDWLNLVDFT